MGHTMTLDFYCQRYYCLLIVDMYQVRQLRSTQKDSPLCRYNYLANLVIQIKYRLFVLFWWTLIYNKFIVDVYLAVFKFSEQWVNHNIMVSQLFCASINVSIGLIIYMYRCILACLKLYIKLGNDAILSGNDYNLSQSLSLVFWFLTIN